jgi:hypothetical protein
MATFSFYEHCVRIFEVHPTTGNEDPGGEYGYSSTLSLTSALDEDGWSTPHPGRFTSVKDPVPIA